MNKKRCMLTLVCLLAWGLCGGCDKPADSSAATSSTDETDGPTGSIRVAGGGVDLYHVFRPGTKEMVDFSATGMALRVRAGEYEV